MGITRFKIMNEKALRTLSPFSFLMSMLVELSFYLEMFTVLTSNSVCTLDTGTHLTTMGEKLCVSVI